MNSIVEFVKSDAGKMTAACVLLVVEYWLGRTDKVKAGSILESILNGVKSLVKMIKGEPKV